MSPVPYSTDLGVWFAVVSGSSTPYLACRRCREWVCDVGEGDLLSYLVREAGEHAEFCRPARTPEVGE